MFSKGIFFCALFMHFKIILNILHRENVQSLSSDTCPAKSICPPSDLIVTNDSAGSKVTSVTDNEIETFTDSLLPLDVNNAAKYLIVNLQSKTKSHVPDDKAPLPMLNFNTATLRNLPTLEKLNRLFDNYVLRSDVNEVVTPQEQTEENDFLDAVLSTPIMNKTLQFLSSKQILNNNVADFKSTLHGIWFALYPRMKRKVGSSGFEHVFMAEIKRGQITGLHSWLYFYEKEEQNAVNYLGYLREVDLGHNGTVLKYHMIFEGIDKPVNSMFLGTSPEFEMALYTTCFLLRPDESCRVKVSGKVFHIQTFTFRYRNKNLLGSAFPVI